MSGHDLWREINKTAEPNGARNVAEFNIKNMGKLLRKYFPATIGYKQDFTPVVFALGNNDVSPDYNFPGQGQPGFDASREYLRTVTSYLDEAWGLWSNPTSPGDSKQLFSEHGYYVYRLGSLTHRIILNYLELS